MYHQSKDYTQLAKIWNGPHPEDGKPLVVTDEMPKGYPCAGPRRRSRNSFPRAPSTRT